LQLVEKYGQKSWMKIAAELGNRADVQCRYHFFQMQRGGRPKGKIATTRSAEELPTAPPFDVAAIGIETSQSVPTDLTKKPEILSSAFPENLTLDAATGARKSDPLFSSDFWVF
jgi:hypothetical protein